MNIKILILFIILLLGVFTPRPVHPNVVSMIVIVNPLNECTCNLDFISKVYLGRVHNFRDGSKATAITYSSESAIRAKFYDQVLHSNKNRLGKLWSRLIFSGRSTTPIVLDTYEEVLKRVASNKKYIGFIPSHMVTPEVKVVGKL